MQSYVKATQRKKIKNPFGHILRSCLCSEDWHYPRTQHTYMSAVYVKGHSWRNVPVGDKFYWSILESYLNVFQVKKKMKVSEYLANYLCHQLHKE